MEKSKSRPGSCGEKEGRNDLSLMAEITKISLQKNQKRFNIFLDGKYSFSLSEESLADSHLAVGQEFDEKKVKELISKSEFQKILDKAMRYISLRPRSISEMRQYLGFKLKGKEESGFLIEKVIDRLVGNKFLDDEVFARWWIDQRATFRPRGKMAIKSELRHKGIDDDLVRKLVESEVDEISLAGKTVLKKLNTMKRLTGFEKKRKIASMLSRRGFSWQIIKEAMKGIKD